MPAGLFIKHGDVPAERFVGSHRVKPGGNFRTSLPVFMNEDTRPDDVELVAVLENEKTDDELVQEALRAVLRRSPKLTKPRRQPRVSRGFARRRQRRSRPSDGGNPDDHL